MITKRVSGIAPSLTLEITAKAKKMKSEGISVIGFGAGEPDFNTPEYIIDAAKKALDIGFTKYTPASGMPELKKAICEKFKKDNGLIYEESQIIVSSGAKSSLFHAIEAIVEEGDEVLLPLPYWLTYPELIKLAGGKVVTIKADKENGYKVTAKQIADACTSKTKALILNSPNNPTGAAYTKEQLETWVAYARKNDAVILYDAAYEAFVSDPTIPRSIFCVEGAKECAIELCSLSKTAGFTGTRCGYTVVPHALVRKTASGKEMHLNKMWLRRQTTKFNGVPYIIQRGAEAVFSEEGVAQCRENIAYYQENARIMMAGFDKLGIKYFGGVHSPYIWLQCPNGMSSWEFFDFLLEKLAVVGTPGVGFGSMGEGYFRLTAFGSRENTIEAMNRIVEGLK